MTERVTITIENAVADVCFARPDKLNALDPAQIAAILAAIDQLSTMKGVRCVVLSGEGKGFCAGIDLETLSGSPATRDLMPRTHGQANSFQQLAWGWRTLPMPVIAAVHGFAFGAGFQIMLGADIRIATPDTQLSIMEVRWGLVPDLGGIALLRGLVREDVARELTYTGRKISGEDALALGIVTNVDPDPHSRAMTLARAIATNSPDAVRAGKRLFNLSTEADSSTILLAESREQQLLIKSANHAETLAAARERRPPLFED